MTIVMMAAEMQYSLSLPVGDLSHYWKVAGGETRNTGDAEEV